MQSATATIGAFWQAIKDKDAATIARYYHPSEELYVVLEGPRLTNRGYDNITKGWVDFCDSGLQLVNIVWIEGPYEEAHETMAWVGGVTELTVEIGERIVKQTFRASFVLVKHAGRWVIKHEHVSGALADPYGIGDWLKEEGV